MNQYFSKLSESDYQKLKDAIAEITIYIAGIDGKIDAEEMQWAEKVAEIRTYKMHKDLLEFYQEVGKDYHEKINNLLNTYPKDYRDRNSIIESKLVELNPILASLEPKVGARLYDSYLSFAQHVAKASGGFLGFFSIGAKEKAVLNLPMIAPIIFEYEEEE
jgi:uncharacterized protein (DUF4415 family)